ncbi:uncharacterized protein LOC106649587 [Trichogramma pretiosum]|uniref:uncharacterized protein LOC106649587 n=1 Tax=Trichogramma pretiosum TaxID=7493 RepID=UPI0006C9B89C|nr:uncharacterized protein LOC106649587 [Trichogramma pretiosum]XP_014222538.1 uncharacterized protein LOC106649587 [Trichogramma pretiosum]XP_014222539.1 uncharacterized protein LOC106649587 [Trichogramma pretiosum]XP_014222540.1 uncharacterized protein LOC106649587 [Trichogramma pretiosum]XP_023313300.1 uncharacterized protein LOC106649587 [Trichogramma pretiosum]XP_023313301.1 uncharacterized protein LOC106649587 [Trichogramma pretiosum]
MSKLLRIISLLLLANLAIVSGVLFRDHEDMVPNFFKLTDKSQVNLCCARCIKENDCILVTENAKHRCGGIIDKNSIGLVDFPGGRKITTHQEPDDRWVLSWVDNMSDPVLRSRRFSLNNCAWTSNVLFETDRKVADVAIDTLFHSKRYPEVSVSLEPASCGNVQCDVTIYKRSARISIKTKALTLEKLPRDDL